MPEQVGGQSGSSMKQGHADRGSRHLLVDLVRLLNYFYSFRELEETLGIPSQVLWRYATLRSVPERETARRLLVKIRESGLLESAVARLNLNERELWVLASNPGIIELSAHKVVEALGASRIETVVSAPESYSSAFASVISSRLRATLCLASRERYSEESLYAAYSEGEHHVHALALPAKCLGRGSRALLVAFCARDEPSIAATLGLLAGAHAELCGLFVVVGSRIRLKRLVDELEEREGLRTSSDFKVLTLIDLDARSQQI
ncbi:MAG: hypothetical protein QXU97_05510 [Fervidicoccaceae archaeon]